MNKSRILVTGGTGFLGSYILRYLVENGYTNIYAIHRKSSSFDLVKEIKDRVNWVECDILDYKGIEDLIINVDYVIHSAAMISFAKKEISKMFQINIKGTEQLVNLSLEHGIKKFILISSISALGREIDGQVLNEDNKWVKSKYTTNYAISKYYSEQECFRGAAEGLNMAILNPSLILGSGFWNGGSTNIFKKVYEGLNFYTNGGTGIVDVRDVAILAVKLLESNISGKRIIANAKNISFKELITGISKEFDRKPPSKSIGPILQGLAWRIEFIKSILKNDTPIITKETMRQTAATFSFDNQRSKEMLNHEYIDWQKTIVDSSKAYKSFVMNGKIEPLGF